MRRRNNNFTLTNRVMQQDHKDLLLKDLSARVPYGVKAYVKYWSKLERKWIEGIYTVKSVYPSPLSTIFVVSELGSVEVILGHDDYEIKPYLFPMSSMPEESEREFDATLEWVDTSEGYSESVLTYDSFDCLNKCHIDYRDLISIGLANDATGLNIYD